MPHYSLLIGPKAHSSKLPLNNWLSWPRFRTEAATLQRTKRIMSSTFSTERPKATGCHRAEWSQCNEKSVITCNYFVWLFRCSVDSNSHMLSLISPTMTLLHCRPLHWENGFSAARLNAAVCCLRLERWWLGPLHFLIFILRDDKSKLVVQQKFPVEPMSCSCLVMFTCDTLMAAILILHTPWCLPLDDLDSWFETAIHRKDVRKS